MKTFTQKVLEVTANIKSGEMLTYKEVAKLAGNPGAARAVGTILNKNYNKDIPCHRVIRSDAKLGGYNRGPEKKIALLRAEGAIK